MGHVRIIHDLALPSPPAVSDKGCHQYLYPCLEGLRSRQPCPLVRSRSQPAPVALEPQHRVDRDTAQYQLQFLSDRPQRMRVRRRRGFQFRSIHCLESCGQTNLLSTLIGRSPTTSFTFALSKERARPGVNSDDDDG